jgi:hypothetical protein
MGDSSGRTVERIDEEELREAIKQCSINQMQKVKQAAKKQSS